MTGHDYKFAFVGLSYKDKVFGNAQILRTQSSLTCKLFTIHYIISHASNFSSWYNEMK
jgi:hypothetical protein